MAKENTIFWITADNFIHVDKPVIAELQKKFRIEWYVKFYRNHAKNGFSEDDISRFSQDKNIGVRCVYFRHRLRSIHTLKDYLRLLRDIKKQNPSLLYIDGLGIPYLFFCVIVLFKRNRVIFALHDVVSHVGAENRIYLNLYKWCIMHWSRHLHIFSKSQKRIFEKKYAGKHILNAALALGDYGKSNKKTVEGRICFLFFGAIRENKGLEYLIEASQMVAKISPVPIKVIIVGKCMTDWRRYQALIQNRSLFVLSIKHVGNDEIPDLFAQSHFLVLPYKDVTQSGPLNIAYNYNVPVIASDHEGFREYIEPGKNGFLFKNKSVESLAETMLKVISLSREEYEQVKFNQREYTKANLSLSAIADAYGHYFKQVAPEISVVNRP